MAHKRKTKIKIKVGIILTVLLIIFLFFTPYQKVNIIYFTNSKCLLTVQTDRLIEEIRNDFGNRVHVREIVVSMYEDDPQDTEEIKQLRQEYQVFGVPVIIINGKEFTREFTKNNLEQEICKNFIIKPEAC